MFFDPVWPGIVSSQNEFDVSLKGLVKEPQVLCASSDVLIRIKGILDTHKAGRIGHKLHETLRSLMRHSLGIKVRLSLHHGLYEGRINAVVVCMLKNEGVKSVVIDIFRETLAGTIRDEDPVCLFPCRFNIREMIDAIVIHVSVNAAETVDRNKAKEQKK